MNEYTNTKKCPGCGGSIFKFVNVSNDTYNMTCGYTSIFLSDITTNGVTRKHVETPCKKLPCGFSIELTSIENNMIDLQQTNKNMLYSVPNYQYTPGDHVPPVEEVSDDDNDSDEYEYEDDNYDDSDNDDNESDTSVISDIID